MKRHSGWSMLISLLVVVGVVGLAAAQQPKYGGTLRVAWESEMTGFDPHWSPGLQVQYMVGNLFNSLVTIDEHLNYIPELAESWEVQDNGKVYVFRLHKGVKFHDGTDFDAAAVAWNFERIMDKEEQAFARPFFDIIETVEPLDAHTVKFTLKYPTQTFLPTLAVHRVGFLIKSPNTYQGLRCLSKPLQSWKPNRTTTVTEVAPKFVDRKVLIIPFPLQHTKGHQTAGQMMPLSTLRARLTARQPELIFADADDLLNLGPHAIQPPHLCSRQCQAIRGVVLGAVSDHQDLQATRQPATLRPIGVPAIGTHGLSVEPAVLLQAAYEIPPIVTNPLQQPSGGIPSIEQHKFGAAAQAMAGIAQQLQSQLVLRGSPLAPEPHPQRDPERPIRPHEQDQREAIHGATLLTGEHPRQPFNSPRKRLWNDRIVNDEIPSLPAEERAHGKGQECMPGPIRLQ
jgi:Bacterial extracellular solute-binding proteins, family 5 Middle